MRSSPAGDFKTVEIPGRTVKKHCARAGVPFAKAATAATGGLTENNEVISALLLIDQKRLDPPNQYSVADLRAVTSALKISRGRKQDTIAIIKQQLRLAGIAR